jgi:hypothetical protein
MDLSQRSLSKLIPIYDAAKDFGFYFDWPIPEAADAFNISPSPNYRASIKTNVRPSYGLGGICRV